MAKGCWSPLEKVVDAGDASTSPAGDSECWASFVVPARADLQAEKSDTAPQGTGPDMAQGGPRVELSVVVQAEPRERPDLG